MNVKGGGALDATTVQSSTMSRRRRASKSTSNFPDRLKKRDIAFTHQTVSVVKKVGEFGTSYLYSAKDDNAVRGDGKLLLIKATAAATTEQARRAEAEVGLLRKLSGAPGIPTIIDCGFSTIEERMYDHSVEDDWLEARRLYCVLLEPCPDCFLNEFTKKRRRKFTTKGSRSLFARKKKDVAWEGYLPLDTILDIFEQMVLAISAIHNFREDTATTETPSEEQGDTLEVQAQGIVHLDVQPSRFFVRRIKEKGDTEQCYDVKLCSFGCSIRGGMSIASAKEREEATKLIESSSSPMYRSPEMIDLNLADELNTRYDFCPAMIGNAFFRRSPLCSSSADIWGLGCCLYELLFLTECFKGHSKQKLLRGVFLVPSKHPYPLDVIELLARMLTVNSSKRATIEEVQDCLVCLKNGESMPPRRSPLPPSFENQGPLDRLEDLGDVNSRGNASVGETTSEPYRLPSVMHSDNVGEGDTTDYQSEGFHDSVGDCGCSSDGTDFSQWLEFKPGSSDGLNLEKRVAPFTFSTRVVRKGSVRRRKRYNDPLSLGAASASVNKKDEKRQHLFSDRKLGPINQLSSRSLNPIESCASENGSGSGEKDSGITPVVKPSLRMINPYGLALKTKDSPGIGRSYGPGRFLSSAPSLRVADLMMKSRRFYGTSTSSSEIFSCSTNDMHESDFQSSMEGPDTSSEFYSSGEIPPSSDTALPSADFTKIPMPEPTKLTSIDESCSHERQAESPQDISWATDAPLSATIRTGSSSMSNRGLSPNVPPANVLLSMSKSEMISPKGLDRSRRHEADISEETSFGSIHASDSRPEMKKMKKFKEKSKKKKKKSKKTSRNEGYPTLPTNTDDGSRQVSSSIVGGTDAASLHLDNMKSAYRLTNAVVCTAANDPESQARTTGEEMDEPGGERSSTGDDDAGGARFIERDIPSFGNSKLLHDRGSFTAGSTELSANKPHKKRKSKSSKGEPDGSMSIEDLGDSLTENMASSSVSLQDPWDLKAAEHWVATRSKEVSALSPPTIPREDAKSRREKYKADDPRFIKTVDNSIGKEVPKNWVTDAKLWLTDESHTKLSKMKKGMNEEASGRLTESEVALDWFATPRVKSRTFFVPEAQATIDAAGFPLAPQVCIDRTIPEPPPFAMRLERTSRPFKSSPLDERFTTPQPRRERLDVPRSAVSMKELSRTERAERRSGRSSGSYRTLDSDGTNIFSVSSSKSKPTKSGSTHRSNKTLNSSKQPSVDSNIPPGDAVVGAEVSVPLARGSKMSVEDAVHMALTAEGRQMKRSIKKMKERSPHRLLSKMLLHEREPQSERTEGSAVIRSQETDSMKIPPMIELISAGDAADERPGPASSSPKRTFVHRSSGALSKDNQVLQLPETPMAPPSPSFAALADDQKTPLLEETLAPGFAPRGALERDGSKRVKKKKVVKERKSERMAAKK